MLIQIDAVYRNGETVAFNCCSQRGRKTVNLTRALPTELLFRFCNENGDREEILALDEFHSAQILISSRDRLLFSSEENISFQLDADGYQTLRIVDLNIDNADVRNVLADSYLEVEPRKWGICDCDFSVAIYSGNPDRQMQLFFTVDCCIKNVITGAAEGK